MTTPSKLLALSRARRVLHASRRMHRAVTHTPPPQLAFTSNDVYLRALYEDLMTSDSATSPGVHLQHSQKASKHFDIVPKNITSKTTELASDTTDTLLAEYAKQGNTRDFDLLMSRMVSAPPTEHQRDLHIKAHIVNASLSPHSSFSTTQRFPTSALAVLHQYEASGHFAPIMSYTRIISALFNVQTCDARLGRAAAQAQAWDLFGHMRYVAHPVPDAHLYALMIRACGSFSRPEPERALDLWTEMQANGVKPTRGAYEAVIRVCGRAGPEWLGEGMRIAREMADKYSITGVDGKGLWCALLEGCKRAGDLYKARWIFSEAVRDSGSSVDGGAMVDEELMIHMFHTYASYKPPFRRETTRLIDGDAASIEEASTNEAPAKERLSQSDSPARMPAGQTWGGDVSPDVPVKNMESAASFSRLPPQTPSDVIAETRALFNRILQDRFLSLDESRHPTPGGLPAGGLAHVELTPALLNAYLSVFYRHASIETSKEVFDFLFSDSPNAQVLQPDEHSYINALERCAIARTEDRHIAVRWAKEVWRCWEVTEAAGLRDGKGNVGSFARLVEKAHAAMRRVLALSGDVDGALTLLRSFVSRYPPTAVLQPADSQSTLLDTSPIVMSIKSPSRSTTVQLFAKPPILSTRTVLTNPASTSSSTARPLVRLTSVVTPKDDHIPPVIGFSDIDLLHARLAEHGRIKDLGYIKWVCMAYTNALKKRRDAVLKATPTRHEDEVD